MLSLGPCGERKQPNNSVGVVVRILPERKKILGMIRFIAWDSVVLSVSCQVPRVRKVAVFVLALWKLTRNKLAFRLHPLPEVRKRVTVIQSPLLLDFKTDTVKCANSSIKIPYVTKHEIVSRNYYKVGGKSIVFPSYVEYDSAAHNMTFS